MEHRGLTIGCGYLIEPVELPIYEGETAADQLLRLLSLNGLVGYYGGAPAAGEGFYLAYIADGNASAAKYNGYTRSAAPASPRTLGPRHPAAADFPSRTDDDLF